MAIVYEHIFPNGKKYVGITSQRPTKRWQRGKNYKNNPHLERAIEKYGWDSIEHKIIGEYSTLKEAGEIEKQIIANEKLQNPDFGYNISDGGEHGKHNRETIKKLSAERKGSKNPMYGRKGFLSPRFGKPGCMNGKHLTEEAKAKISKANSGKRNGMYGKKISEENKQFLRWINSGANNKKSIKVMCVETGVVYSSSGEAARETGCHQGHISECCNGTHKTTGGFHWRYANE